MNSRFLSHLLESLKSLKRNGWMTVAAVSSVMITLGLVAIFVSVILNTAKLATDIENNVRVMVYMRQIQRTIKRPLQKKVKQSRMRIIIKFMTPSIRCLM